MSETPRTDRIHVAWELRRDLHAFLVTNGRSSILEIFVAFPSVHRETVRKTVNRLRKDDDCYMTRDRGRAGVFAAVTANIKPESFTREKLTTAGMSKFQIAHQTRQSILDYANEAGQCSTSDAAMVASITISHAYRVMSRMVEEGELRRRTVGLDAYYAPLATESMTAEATRARQVRRHALTTDDIKQHKPVAGPGHYVHKPGLMCIKNQGGQGNVRERVWAGSSM